MADAIADTGPILHLSEISYLRALNIFTRLSMPSRVLEELQSHGVERENIAQQLQELVFVDVPETKWLPLTQMVGQPVIHAADAQVFVVAQENEKLLSDME